MKIKLTTLLTSLNKLRYDFSEYSGEKVEEVVVDISVVEESVDDGMLIGCLLVTSNTDLPATQYKKETNITRTLEIYDESSQLKPRLTKAERQLID